MYTSPRVSFSRYGLFLLAFAFLVGAGTLWLDDTQRARQIELACAKAKLEAMWGVKLPDGAETVGAAPGSRVVSADWDLEELGCSGASHSLASLAEILGERSPADFSYTAAIPSKPSELPGATRD
jgi:hypothetical protein